jgi:hypothetical protein
LTQHKAIIGAIYETKKSSSKKTSPLRVLVILQLVVFYIFNFACGKFTGSVSKFLTPTTYVVVIRNTLSAFSNEFRPERPLASDRLGAAIEHFGGKDFSRKDYLVLLRQFQLRSRAAI